MVLKKIFNLKGGIVCFLRPRPAPPGGSVDGGGGGDGELALVVSRPVVVLVENLLVDVVPLLVLLHSVGVRVHLGLHHHGGGYHLTITVVMGKQNLPALIL